MAKIKVRVVKNPKKWALPYSVRVLVSPSAARLIGRKWGIFSQHRTLSAAQDVASKVASKYKSGDQALGYIR